MRLSSAVPATMMPIWTTSLLFAILVVTIPFTFIIRLLLQLPRPVALSHKRWPLPLNVALTGVLTSYMAIFIRSAYYGRGEPASMLMEFFIAGVAYAFGLVLLLRQFSGVYPEYIVTTGRTGLALRKTSYPNVVNVQEVSCDHGESRLLVKTAHGVTLSFTLPARDVEAFYERLKTNVR